MRSLFSVAGLLAAASAYVLPSPAPLPQNVRRNVVSGPTAGGPPVLVPINLDAYESAVGLYPRDVADFSRLDPKSQAQLVYGTPGNDGSILLANLTLYAPDGKLLVSMESFEGLTSAVDCDGDDGQLSITFTNKDAFEYAIDKWSFIHENDDEEFLLIANHDGCGPQGERQAYTINDVDNDEGKFITYLKATPAAWEDITGTFDLDFGRAVLAPGAASKLRRRQPGWLDDVGDWLGDAADDVGDWVGDVADEVGDVVDDVADTIGDVAETIGDVVTGNIDVSEEVSFPIGIGSPNSPINIYSGDVVKVDCSNCFIGGTFRVAGTVRVEWWDVKELSLRITPQDFKAALEVTTKISFQASSSDDFSTSTEEMTLFEAPVPGAGLVIPKIFSLGAVVGVDAGVSLTFKSNVEFTLGLNANLPNTAGLFLDLANLGDSSATGWDSVDVTPVVRFDNFDVTVSGEIFMQPKIALKAEITAIGKIEAALNIDLPRITASATVSHNEAGVCEGSTDPFGLALAVAAKLGLSVTIEGELLSIWKDKLLDKKIVDIDIYSNNFCFPFENPLGGGDETPTIDAPADTPDNSSVPNAPAAPPDSPAVPGVPEDTTTAPTTPESEGGVPVGDEDPVVEGDGGLPDDGEAQPPTESAGPVESTGPVKSAGPAQSSRPTGPDQSAGPAETAWPSDPTGSAEPPASESGTDETSGVTSASDAPAPSSGEASVPSSSGGYHSSAPAEPSVSSPSFPQLPGPFANGTYTNPKPTTTYGGSNTENGSPKPTYGNENPTPVNHPYAPPKNTYTAPKPVPTLIKDVWTPISGYDLEVKPAPKPVPRPPGKPSANPASVKDQLTYTQKNSYGAGNVDVHAHPKPAAGQYPKAHGGSSKSNDHFPATYMPEASSAPKPQYSSKPASGKTFGNHGGSQHYSSGNAPSGTEYHPKDAVGGHSASNPGKPETDYHAPAPSKPTITPGKPYTAPPTPYSNCTNTTSTPSKSLRMLRSRRLF